MSKYIDADKLKAEIERLLKCTEQHRGEAVADGSRQTLYWIKDFITALQQEQPEVDLEKEIKIKKATLLDDAFGPMNGEQCLAIRNFAHNFYELGLNARKEDGSHE